jgi:hypothetical protein
MALLHNHNDAYPIVITGYSDHFALSGLIDNRELTGKTFNNR